MRPLASCLAALALSVCVFLPVSASAQSSGITTVEAVPTVSARPLIGSSRYLSVNGVTFAKTATGLLVVLSPAELDGPGRLDGSAHGLTLEISDFIIRQLFF